MNASTTNVQPKASRNRDLMVTGYIKVAGDLNNHGRMTKARKVANRAERRVAKAMGYNS